MKITVRTVSLIVDAIIVGGLACAGLFFGKQGALICALGLLCLSISWFRNPVSLKTGKLETTQVSVKRGSLIVDYLLISIGLVLVLRGAYLAFS